MTREGQSLISAVYLAEATRALSRVGLSGKVDCDSHLAAFTARAGDFCFDLIRLVFHLHSPFRRYERAFWKSPPILIVMQIRSYPYENPFKLFFICRHHVEQNVGSLAGRHGTIKLFSIG